ncbi:hypothetical protein QJQ45_018139 [Haematococcus lacustris]|nr:hypothetical protein QJQ45_018139 [Haematococcus lacustris]
MCRPSRFFEQRYTIPCVEFSRCGATLGYGPRLAKLMYSCTKDAPRPSCLPCLGLVRHRYAPAYPRRSAAARIITTRAPDTSDSVAPSTSDSVASDSEASSAVAAEDVNEQPDLEVVEDCAEEWVAKDWTHEEWKLAMQTIDLDHVDQVDACAHIGSHMDPPGPVPPDGARTNPGLNSTTALVLVKRSKSRSKGSKKLLKLLVKAATRFGASAQLVTLMPIMPANQPSDDVHVCIVYAVDTLSSLPILVPASSMLYQPVLIMGLGLVWLGAGASLVGLAASKVVTFSPAALQPPGFGLLVAAGRVVQHISDAALERIAAVFVTWSTQSLPLKVPMVLLAAVPLVLVLAAAYHRATGTPWEVALLKIHAVVHRQPVGDPPTPAESQPNKCGSVHGNTVRSMMTQGANMVSEKSLAGLLLLNVSFFSGMFLVAVLFGLVSDEVKRSFRDVKNGAFAIRGSGHILILNHNRHTIPLLRQLGNGRRYSEDAFFRQPVVIMADKPKHEMDDEITARLKSTSLDIVTRSGNPASCRDLAMVAAGQADTVIVLHPDSHTSQQAAEAVKAATAMALSVEGRHSTQKVVMQMPNELTVNDYMKSFTRTVSTACPRLPTLSASVASSAAGSAASMQLAADSFAMQQAAACPRILPSHGTNMQVLQLPDGNFMDRFTCHTALQPGVFRVWLKILQQGPSNVKLRVKALPAMLHGRTFAEVRRSFRDCIVVGYIRGQDPCFDPLDTQVMLPEQDRLIVLSYVASPAPCTQAQPIYKVAANAASERLARPATYQPAPRKVIVAGWHAPELPDMVQGFADAAPEASQITFILRQALNMIMAGSDHSLVLVLHGGVKTRPEATARVWLVQVPDPSPPSRVGGCRFTYLQADHPTSLRALLDAGIKTADAVVLGMNEELQSQVEADALVLASLLQVQDAVIASGRARAPHVVAKVHRFGTMQVINQYFDMLYPKQPVAPRSHPVPAHQALQPQKPAPATPLALSRLWHIPESVLLEAQEIQAAAAVSKLAGKGPGSSSLSLGSTPVPVGTAAGGPAAGGMTAAGPVSAAGLQGSSAVTGAAGVVQGTEPHSSAAGAGQARPGQVLTSLSSSSSSSSSKGESGQGAGHLATAPHLAALDVSWQAHHHANWAATMDLVASPAASALVPALCGHGAAPSQLPCKPAAVAPATASSPTSTRPWANLFQGSPAADTGPGAVHNTLSGGPASQWQGGTAPAPAPQHGAPVTAPGHQIFTSTASLSHPAPLAAQQAPRPGPALQEGQTSSHPCSSSSSASPSVAHSSSSPGISQTPNDSNQMPNSTAAPSSTLPAAGAGAGVSAGVVSSTSGTSTAPLAVSTASLLPPAALMPATMSGSSAAPNPTTSSSTSTITTSSASTSTAAPIAAAAPQVSLPATTPAAAAAVKKAPGGAAGAAAPRPVVGSPILHRPEVRVLPHHPVFLRCDQQQEQQQQQQYMAFANEAAAVAHGTASICYVSLHLAYAAMCGGSGRGGGFHWVPLVAAAGPCLCPDPAQVFMPDEISAALLTLVSAHPDVMQASHLALTTHRPGQATPPPLGSTSSADLLLQQAVPCAAELLWCLHRPGIVQQLLTTRQGVELYLRNPALFNLNEGEAGPRVWVSQSAHTALPRGLWVGCCRMDGVLPHGDGILPLVCKRWVVWQKSTPCAGERVTFAEVTEAARLMKQTALGYIRDGEIHLVPEPEHVVCVTHGDEIIVFCDDFKTKRVGGWGR